MGKKGRQRLFALRFFSAFFPIGESVFLRLSVGRKRVCGAEIRRPAQFFLPPKKGGFFYGQKFNAQNHFFGCCRRADLCCNGVYSGALR